MVDSIISPLTDLAKDYLEIGLDSFIDDESVKSIPVVGTIAKVGSASVAIRDRLFARKVYRFLFELKGTSLQDRIEFVEKLGDDTKRTQAGSILLDLLDKTDGNDKAAILGALIRAAIQSEIYPHDAFHIAFMVNQVHIRDLIFLKRLSGVGSKSTWMKVANVPELDPESDAPIHRLAAAGLVRVRPSRIIDDNLAEEWQITVAGARVIEHALGDIEISAVYEPV